MGNTSQTVYDAAGRQTVLINPDTGITTTTYDAASQVTAVTIRSMMRRRTYTMRPIREISANNGITTTVYDNAGQVTARINALDVPSSVESGGVGLGVF